MLVLALSLLLGSIGVGTVVIARASVDVARTVRTETELRHAAESALARAEREIVMLLGAVESSGGGSVAYETLQALSIFREALDFDASTVRLELEDPGARLDVNLATLEQLTALFSITAQRPDAARRTARAISLVDGAQSETGRYEQPARLFLSLDALRRHPDVDENELARALPYLTVDGDGTINRVTASRTVLQIAGGQLRTTPSRLLLLARAFQPGSSLVWRIEQAYAIDGLRMIRVARREGEQ
jgi:type II secretory pathway component PulK